MYSHFGHLVLLSLLFDKGMFYKYPVGFWLFPLSSNVPDFSEIKPWDASQGFISETQEEFLDAATINVPF